MHDIFLTHKRILEVDGGPGLGEWFHIVRDPDPSFLLCHALLPFLEKCATSWKYYVTFPLVSQSELGHKPTLK